MRARTFPLSTRAWLELAICRFLLLAITVVGAGDGVIDRSHCRAAAPELRSLFPSGVQVGQSVDVEAKGKFDKWPAQVWVDRPGLQLQLATDKGKLKAVAADDAEPQADLNASVEYRTHLAKVLVRRALEEAGA